MNLGLGYDSSDEEEVSKPVKTEKPIVNAEAPITAPSPPKSRVPHIGHTQPPSRPIIGPARGPSLDPNVSSSPAIGSSPNGDPGTPYTSSRAAIQNLTLPNVPNFDIPPSPPGSPPQQATKKFAKFLDLKKEGQHFNQRLETSSVLRDPGHLQRLYDYAGITAESQYDSTLPEDLAVPTSFPEWAYAEELNASQKDIRRANEESNARNPRQVIDFVTAKGSNPSSKAGTPTGKNVEVGKTRQPVSGRIN